MINLSSLPPDHDLRNRKLGEIDAEYRNIKQGPNAWKRAGLIKIGNYTFNQLSGPWIECNEWRVNPESAASTLPTNPNPENTAV